MKTLVFVLALASLMPAAVAQTVDEAHIKPLVELAALTDCTATEVALMQMHQQTVAAIRATMPDATPPQLGKLLDSYTVLAKDAHEQVDSYMATINDVVIPEIVQAGGDAESISQKFMTVLYHKIVRNAVALSDPTSSIEERTTGVRGLIDRANQCASLAAAVREEHKGTTK